MRALVLIGFMGAGKSAAARRAAAARGGTALDTDALLVERLGTSIEAFFDREGEGAFRAEEERTVLEALDRAGPADVVALGGGALGSARVREALRRHVCAYLEVDAATAWARVAGSGRPLARDPQRFAALLAEREPVYEQAADAFLPQDAPPAAVEALADLRPGLRLVWGIGHPVWLGADAWPRPRPGDVLVVDANVAGVHDGWFDAGRAIRVPPGEQHKTLATAEQVWRTMAEMGVTRAERVVALGGGVVGDLAGFCAATYQRGVAVVHVPTTVVAQVDSAYGGKTGVDLPEAKNYVGAYHQPQAVHVVGQALATLPAAEHAAGYAEVVKTALIAGGRLWERVADGADVDEDVVLACARTKLRIVAADERDAGLRQVLNLGHTVGHALETVTGYARLRHGEAVGLGLLAALRLSGQAELRERVAELLADRGLPTSIRDVDPVAVVAATRRDKKRTGLAVPFVLVSAPGDVRFGTPVPDADVLAAVRELTR